MSASPRDRRGDASPPPPTSIEGERFVVSAEPFAAPTTIVAPKTFDEPIVVEEPPFIEYVVVERIDVRRRQIEPSSILFLDDAALATNSAVDVDAFRPSPAAFVVSRATDALPPFVQAPAPESPSRSSFAALPLENRAIPSDVPPRLEPRRRETPPSRSKISNDVEPRKTAPQRVVLPKRPPTRRAETSNRPASPPRRDEEPFRAERRSSEPFPNDAPTPLATVLPRTANAQLDATLRAAARSNDEEPNFSRLFVATETSRVDPRQIFEKMRASSSSISAG